MSWVFVWVKLATLGESTLNIHIINTDQTILISLICSQDCDERYININISYDENIHVNIRMSSRWCFS